MGGKNTKDPMPWILIALLALVLLLFGSGMMAFGTIVMLLFWAAIIWLIVSLVNAGRRNPEDTEESAIDVLKKRYARGEIIREQYLEMKKELTR